MLGKFNSLNLARSFASRTIPMSAVVLGDDGRFWVVTIGKMETLLKAGHELA